ncbi:MAG: type II toxin-antitoxin system VapC family toxin [Betaproteobacteria bacterium]|nr:type II toxin-antitoxin system VapC family toxin [Betaproteobacteria bacterium]
MILVDTSVWIDHLRQSDPVLVGLLESGQVLVHPYVVGELALGHLKNRHDVLTNLCNLPAATPATEKEMLGFIEAQALYGLGIGYIDAHLLAAARLTPGTTLWTRDKRLLAVSEQMGLAARLAH